MLRTSTYCIWIDLPDKADRCLIAHGYTGAVDEVGRGTADYLRARRTNRRQRPRFGAWSDESTDSSPVDISQPTPATLAELEERGYLTNLSADEEREFFRGLANHLHSAATQQSSYIIVPTYDCNLRCGYCFQDAMRTDPTLSSLLRPMTCDTADRILSAIDQLEADSAHPSMRRPPRQFTFFGGEPLLQSNAELIGYFIRRAREAGEARFSAVTNGTELHAYRHLLGPHGIQRLQITLDGPRNVHDRSRVREDGSGSFDAIAANIGAALALQVRVTIRMNLSRRSIADLPEFLDFCDEQGWTSNKSFHISLAAIHQPTSSQTNVVFISKRTGDYFRDSGELAAAIRAMAEGDERIRRLQTPDDPIERRLNRYFSDTDIDPVEDYRASFCGAHTGMWVFDAFGDVYACWERLGDRQERIGYIADDGRLVTVSAMLNNWRSRSIASNESCVSCAYAMSCGGGCAVMAEGTSGTIHSNYCDGFGRRFRSAMVRAYERKSLEGAGNMVEQIDCHEC